MNRDRLMTRYTIALIPIGIIINIILSKLVLFLGLPVFLDSIGTIITAALGGYLPGIIVGFFTNVINGVSDPVTLYYGIISIFIAVSAAFLAKKRVFNRPLSSMLAALWFAVLGGGVGSVLTWILYGFSFGSGISAPFAVFIHSHSGISEFMSQFIADMAIDTADKLLSVGVVFLIIRFLPFTLLCRFPDGAVLTRDGAAYADLLKKEKKKTNIKSLRAKVVIIIIVATAILGVFSTIISSVIFTNTITQKYIHTNSGVIDLMLEAVDADKIDGYLKTGVIDEDYTETERELEYIRSCFNEIEYMYIYQIRDDGCYAVFDLDTPELYGLELGERTDFDSSFMPYINDLLAGKQIEPVISDETYGWLLTIYKPIVNSSGKCVAYAAADIKMENIVSDRSSFIIKILSLQFGTAIIIAAFTVWFAEKRVVYPVNAMTEAASDFAYNSDEGHIISSDKIRSLNIKTGDELENLYHVLVKTVDDVERYISDIRTKSELIIQMQENTIISFADMVESRDTNTGEHIRHTAAYVGIIARELKRNGVYADVLTDEYIERIVKSAPLHDIGKIKISDSILNKPGRLTDDEFEQMKTHTVAGREILTEMMSGIEGNNYLCNAIDMAMYHHEKWNGCGYPEGLSGTDIPLCARIMSVADVFDALVSKRSYKEAFSFEKAYQIIVSDAGISFDPAVVTAFEGAAGELRNILQSH